MEEEWFTIRSATLSASLFILRFALGFAAAIIVFSFFGVSPHPVSLLLLLVMISASLFPITAFALEYCKQFSFDNNKAALIILGLLIGKLPPRLKEEAQHGGDKAQGDH